MLVSILSYFLIHSTLIASTRLCVSRFSSSKCMLHRSTKSPISPCLARFTHAPWYTEPRREGGRPAPFTSSLPIASGAFVLTMSLHASFSLSPAPPISSFPMPLLIDIAAIDALTPNPPLTLAEGRREELLSCMDCVDAMKSSSEFAREESENRTPEGGAEPLAGVWTEARTAMALQAAATSAVLIVGAAMCVSVIFAFYV